MNRRALLGAVVPVSAAAAGLLAFGKRESPERPDERRALAAGPPITVGRAVEREDVEYLPSKEAVRYVAYRASENPDGVDAERDESGRAPVYETVDFEQWAAAQGAHTGADAVRDVVESEVSGPLDPLAVSVVDGDGASTSPSISSRSSTGPGRSSSSRRPTSSGSSPPRRPP